MEIKTLEPTGLTPPVRTRYSNTLFIVNNMA